MTISSMSAFRKMYKESQKHLDNEYNNPDFMGTSHDEERGLFSMFHGDKKDIRGFLSTELNMAQDDQAMYEFIQNAIDSHASSFQAHYDERSLLVLNDGEKFSKEGIISILNIGQSTKHDSSSIGRLGIGFKLAHRLIGKGDGLDELINEYKGPIIFTWSDRSQLDEFLSCEGIHADASGGWDDSAAHLFKILITNFPAGVGENVLDLQHKPRVVFSNEELREMREFAHAHLFAEPDQLSHGTIVYLRLGEGKKDMLDESNDSLVDGIQYSLNLPKFKFLSSISINDTSIDKRDIVIESGTVKQGTELFKQIDPEYKDADIEWAFGFVPISDYSDDGLQPIEDLRKSPSFFKFFPIGDEKVGYGLFVHSDSFHTQSNRRELLNDVTNRTLLSHIASAIGDHLSEYASTNPSRFYQLYAGIIHSKPREEKWWINESFWNPLLGKVKSLIPINEATNPLPQTMEDGEFVKIRKTEFVIDLDKIGIVDYHWFKWNSVDNSALCSSAWEKLKLKRWGLVDIIIQCFESSEQNQLCWWMNNLAQERYDNFLNNLNDELNDSNSTAREKAHLESLPLYQFQCGRLSWEEIDRDEDSAYIVTNHHTAPIKSILEKLGYTCTLEPIEKHVLYDYLETQSDRQLFDDMTKNRNLSILSPDEKHTLFHALEGFDEVGQERLKDIALFRNCNGNLSPMCKMIAYESEWGDWMKPYMIHPDDYDKDLDQYLVDSRSLFPTIIEPNMTDIIDGGTDAYTLYKTFSDLWSQRTTNTLLERYGATNHVFSIIEKAPDPGSIITLLNKLDDNVFKLYSNGKYDRTDIIFRVISLIAPLSYDAPRTALRNKLLIDGIPLKSYTERDEVEIKLDGYHITLKLRISDLIPGSNLSSALAAVENQFSSIQGVRKIFSTERVDLVSLRGRILDYLQKPGRVPINPSQYAFLMAESAGNRYQRGSEFDTSVRYQIRFVWTNNVTDMLDFFFSNQLGTLLKAYIGADLPQSPIKIREQLVGKYIFSNEYTLPTERCPQYIEDWCRYNRSKVEFLKGIGLHTGSSDEIQRRKKFKEDTLENWGSELVNCPVGFLNYVKTLAPVKGDKQIDILRNLSKRGHVIIQHCPDDYQNAEEWENDDYENWKNSDKKPRYVTAIKFIDGAMPIRFFYDNTVLAYSTDHDQPDYARIETTLYINKKYCDNLYAILSQIQMKEFYLDPRDIHQLFPPDKYIEENRDLRNEKKELTRRIEDLNRTIEDLKRQRDDKKGPGEIGGTSDSGPSKQEQYNAQVEAQNALKDKFPEWEFPDGYGEMKYDGKPICYSNVEVTDQDGNTFKIVLKSYKNHEAPFMINPLEWEDIESNGARLLVYTHLRNGKACDIYEIPKIDLIGHQPKISITFKTDNLNQDEYADRVTAFADSLRYFSELHFNFDSFHVSENASEFTGVYTKLGGEQSETTDDDL